MNKYKISSKDKLNATYRYQIKMLDLNYTLERLYDNKYEQ